MSESIVRVRGVHKTYGRLKAVDGVSFAVEPAGCVGILGPNGAGKTTMLKMLYGKCLRDPKPPSTIEVFGKDPKRDELYIKHLSGVVPQEGNLDSELTVRQNLKVFTKFYCIEKVEAEQRIDALFEFMELGEKANFKIKELSGGMKRRLLIARALLNQPELLIFDEPTTGLDPQVRHLIWDRIRHLRKSGVTILITTHYMDEAFQLCDKVIIMNLGRVVLEGEPSDLISSNMERHVMEVLRPELMEGREIAAGPGMRLDRTHDEILLYSNDLAALNETAAGLPAGAGHVRPANLEDLFLRITGRKLGEDQ